MKTTAVMRAAYRLLLTVVLFGAATASWAQIVDTGVISGLVKDNSGAVIVNAEVNLRNGATCLESKTASNGDGF